MRKILYLSSFFFLTPILLIISILYASFIHEQKQLTTGFALKNPKIAYAAIPGAKQEIILRVNGEDARVRVVKDFFAAYKSALTPYAETVVSAADKYDLDYRLIPAIAMQESTLCKKIPKNSNNCWGFGIYGKKVTRFTDYNEAINTVTKTLALKYKAQGLETPEQIMSKYTPSSNGSWAKGVSIVMDRLDLGL